MGGVCCTTPQDPGIRHEPDPDVLDRLEPDPDVLDVFFKAAVESEQPSHVNEINHLPVPISGSIEAAATLPSSSEKAATLPHGRRLELFLNATRDGPAITDADLDSFRPRPTEEEAQKMRARGEDPFAGQRLNYLGGTKVPFEPVLRDLQPCEREAFENFERRFPEALAECRGLDRSRFHQIPDRFTMLIFLQADSYKVDASIKRLLKTMVWRQTSGLDDFITNPDWRVVNLFQHLRCRRSVGLDKHGRPLMVDALGDFFGSDNGCRAMPMSKWLLAFGFDLSITSASFREASIRHTRAVHRLAYIADLSGLRFAQCRVMIPFLSQLTKEVESHFPECAGKVLLINAPWFFTAVFALCKVFLDKRTVDTIIVKSGIPTDLIVEAFGAECVPVEFGGRLNYTVTRVRPLDEVLELLSLPGPLTENEEYDSTCAGAQWVPMLPSRKPIS